ncbi:ubiquitin-specific protease ubp2 [Podila horticola]|nr:ubiquitin-specific protease ubp2 [Podila horticola]
METETVTIDHTSAALALSTKGVTPQRWIVDLAHYSIGARPHPHMFYVNPHKSDHISACCQICFKQYNIHVLSSTAGLCSGNMHHLHTTYGSDLVEAKCCRCGSTIYAAPVPPTVPRLIIQVMENSRQPVVEDTTVPEFKDTIKKLIRIFTHALEPGAKSMKPDAKSFTDTFGVDRASDELFAIAGFTLQDGLLRPPKYTPENIETLQTVLFQLQLVLGARYSLTLLHGFYELFHTPLLQKLQGQSYPVHAGKKKLDLSDKATLQTERDCNEGKLGCLSDMTDEWILDAFRTQISHSPTSAHLRIDELIDIKNARRTEKMDVEIVLQRSEGVVCTRELENAYKAFDIPGGGRGISDVVLLDLLRASRSQGSKENLKIILKHRNNPNLNELVNLPDTDTADQEDVDLAIYHAQNPVGLVNIGNTCYLNSVLQYIYTVKDIRDAVINMEAYAKDESDSDWQGKVVDRQTLSKQNVAEAKEVVFELKKLFIQMQSAKTYKVRPTERLAKLLHPKGEGRLNGISTPQMKEENFRQQDVTETMTILMDRLSAALKPVHDTLDSEPVDRFNRYEKNEETDQDEERRIPADFNPLLLNARTEASMEDLIDDYFLGRAPPSLGSPSPQADFSGETATTDPSTSSEDNSRAVTVSELPPILQVHLARSVFYDTAELTAGKSYASVSIPKRLYLDEYLEENKEEGSRGRYKKIKLWRGERRRCRESLATLRKVSVPNIQSHEPLEKDSSSTPSDEAPPAKDITMQDKIDYQLKTMAQLARNIEEEIQTLAQSEYRLHAVFHHEGMATFGHYWVYIFDHQKGSEPRWIKYSDETVTEIRLDQEDEVFNGVEGSTAIFCVYVRDTDSDVVQTVHRVIQ